MNIERDKHLPKVVALLKKEKPEVICLQEVQEPDFEMLKEKFGYGGFFVPMNSFLRNENSKQEPVRQGIAYYSNLPFLKTESLFYVGKGTAPVQKSGNDIDRVLVSGMVEKEGETYTIATTHFTWADDGGVNEEQRRDLKQLLKLLRQRGELVLCGDFNLLPDTKSLAILEEDMNNLIKDYTEIRTKISINQVGSIELGFQKKLHISRDEWFRILASNEIDRLKILKLAWRKNATTKTRIETPSSHDKTLYPKSGWLGDFVFDYSRVIESPDSFLFWSGVAAIAATARRHVYVQFGARKIYPNFYIILTAKAGMARKGTPIKAAEAFAKTVQDINFLCHRML